MMKNPKIVFQPSRWWVRVFILCLTLFLSSAAARAGVIDQTDDPMVIGGGARPLGMGRAFAAIADDCDTIFINPGGLASLKAPQAMIMFTTLLEDVYYREFSGTIPTDYGTAGIGYIGTGVNGVPTEGIPSDYYDNMLVLSYGTPLARIFRYGRNIFVGGNYKIFSRGWSGGLNQSAVGMSADLGAKLVYNPYLSFGLNFQNIVPPALGGVLTWGNGTQESLAGLAKFGIVVRPIIFDSKLLVTYDIDLPYSSVRPVTMHLGTEWKMHPNLAVRGGLDQSLDASTASGTSWNPTLGLSLEYKGIRLDYAYHPFYNYPALATSYVSLSYIGEPSNALKGETVHPVEGGRRTH
jgi:hypothetical protein